MIEPRVLRKRGNTAAVVGWDCPAGIADKECELVVPKDVEWKNSRVSYILILGTTVDAVLFDTIGDPIGLGGAVALSLLNSETQRWRNFGWALSGIWGQKVVCYIFNKNTLIFLPE